MSSIWEKLSKIDCTAHIDKKGQFSYLAWTWAWAMVKEHYPLAEYHLEPDTVFPDGTMEVRVSVVIEGLQHTMWLPVLDFKNKAVQNPNAFDINASRMRCLVKCLAMFGLGHYIYAGESLPQAPAVDITSVVEAIESTATLEELQAEFKRAWGAYPSARKSLTEAKDKRKQELAS